MSSFSGQDLMAGPPPTHLPEDPAAAELAGRYASGELSPAEAVDAAFTVVDDAEPAHVYWRFVEHRNEDPLLPPGVGYMQGTAGIAAYLFRFARVLGQGRDAEAVARMDTWWALPA